MHPGYNTKIYGIVAAGLMGEIGRADRLLWRQKSDLKRFKLLTIAYGCVIMGRKTFESIGKPLERRLNVVLTSGDSIQETDQVKPVKTIAQAMEACKGRDAVFVIGGQSVYEQFLPYYDELYITQIEDYFPDADAHFNLILTDSFTLKDIESFKRDSENEYDYKFLTLQRDTRPLWSETKMT